jgi:hypothetical protein
LHRPRDGVGRGNDYVRVTADGLASEIGIALGPTPAGIPLDDQVLSLDMAKSAQLLEKRLPCANSLIVNAGDGSCRDDDRKSMLLRPFLRPIGCAADASNKPIAKSRRLSRSSRRDTVLPPSLGRASEGLPWHEWVGDGVYGSLDRFTGSPDPS